MGVHNVQGLKEYEATVVEGSKQQLVVLDCFATWCGPCKQIAPEIVKLADQHQNVLFAKVDVDESPDVASELGVRAMPTFFFFKDGENVGQIVGANVKGIETLVEKHK